MLLKIIRLLRGYVVFAVSGAFPERLINLLNTRGIRYWDIVPSEYGFSGCMLLSDYLRIRPTARRVRVRLRVKESRGLPFFARRYRSRKGLLIGAAASLVILMFLSQFVWDVRFVGNDKISSSQLYSACEKCGFKVGMFKGSLDVIEVERKLELMLPDIRWLSVNALNNVATVEIKEREKKPKLAERTYPCNIKASEDGVITNIITHSGTCEVKRGSAVTRNQLLVNSVVASGDESLRYVHSDAEIFADVRRNKRIIIPKTNNKLTLGDKYTEKENLKFLFFDIPLSFSSSLDGTKLMTYSEEAVVGNDVTLPLGRTLERTYYLSQSRQTLSKKQAESLLRTRLALCECFAFGNCEIRQKSASVTETEDGFALNADFVINKNIAKEQKLYIKGSDMVQ